MNGAGESEHNSTNQKASSVLVTGGAGFIGSHLVDRLLTDGHRVTVIDNLSTGSMANLAEARRHPNLTVLEQSLGDVDRLDELVAKASAVYHLAATVGVDLVLTQTSSSIENNYREAAQVLQCAARHGVPTLIASSSEVYGKNARESFSETDDLVIGPPTTARWSYASSKLTIEFLALALAREAKLPVVVARIFNTVGPRQTGRYGMVLPRFMDTARRGQRLRVFGDGRQTRCFCWIGDTVEALIRLLNSTAARGQIVNVGSAHSIEILELARLVSREFGVKEEPELVPYSQAYAAGFEELRHRRPDLARLAKLTGFTPSRSIQEIIQRLAEIIRATPPIESESLQLGQSL